MRTYLVAVKLLAQAHDQPESAIAEVLDGILTPDMRKHAGRSSTGWSRAKTWQCRLHPFL
jgi:hypothetical protein